MKLSAIAKTKPESLIPFMSLADLLAIAAEGCANDPVEDADTSDTIPTAVYSHDTFPEG